MYRFIRALRYRDMMSFKEQFRSVDVLMIDDVQFISGKDPTQEEFFHTFNALVEDGRQVVLQQINHRQIYQAWKRGCGHVWARMVADIHPLTMNCALVFFRRAAISQVLMFQIRCLIFLLQNYVQYSRNRRSF